MYSFELCIVVAPGSSLAPVSKRIWAGGFYISIHSYGYGAFGIASGRQVGDKGGSSCRAPEAERVTCPVGSSQAGRIGAWWMHVCAQP